MKTATLAGTLAAITLSLTAPPVAGAVSFTTTVPAVICPAIAPAAGCARTLPLDLRGVTKYRLVVQARNFAGGIVPSDAIIFAQDATDDISCLDPACTPVIVPFATPSLGSCCAPVFSSALITLPIEHRKIGRRLRITTSGGDSITDMSVMIQLYYF